MWHLLVVNGATNFSSVIPMSLARNSNSAVLEFLSSSALFSSTTLITSTGVRDCYSRLRERCIHGPCTRFTGISTRAPQPHQVPREEVPVFSIWPVLGNNPEISDLNHIFFQVGYLSIFGHWWVEILRGFVSGRDGTGVGARVGYHLGHRGLA